MLVHFFQLAGDDHDCFFHAWGKTAIGLHGEHSLAITDEFDGHAAGIQADVASTKTEALKGSFEAFERNDIVVSNLGDMFHSGQRASALENFIGAHFTFDSKDCAEF